MYKTVITTATIVLSLLILVWSGCKKDNGPDTEEYIIQVDSIIHLVTITFGEDLSIKFYVTLKTSNKVFRKGINNFGFFFINTIIFLIYIN